MFLQETRSRRILLIALMFLFFLLYVTIEFSINSFLPTFGVKSRLGLTYKEGAMLMTYYLGPFMVMRIATIFVAMKLRPIHILGLNLVFCTAGAVTNVVMRDTSLLATKIAFGLFGTGTSSMFGNSMMWVEQYITVIKVKLYMQ